MKIDQAIETLQEILDDEESRWEPDGQTSLKLGIKALERIKSFRTNMGSQKFWQLPGETLD